jgi:hypothetical protein
MDQDTLRLIIRRKLANGGLPHNNIPRIWGGPGSGEECDACEDVIRAGQLLMEGVSTTTNQGIQLHVECFSLWDRERDAPGRYDPGPDVASRPKEEGPALSDRPKEVAPRREASGESPRDRSGTPALPAQQAIRQPEQFRNQRACRREGEREDGHGGLELPEEEPDRDRLGVLQGKDHDEEKNHGQDDQVQH